MPALARPIVDERDGLLLFLNQARDALRASVFGLTEEQGPVQAQREQLSLAGLLKHASLTERYWIVNVLGQQPLPVEQNWDDRFRPGDDETVAVLLDRYAAVAGKTEAAVAAIDDLSQPVPVPKGVPWFPTDVAYWSARWVLLHLINETTRHAGHADIIRESIDGSNAFALIATAEAAT